MRSQLAAALIALAVPSTQPHGTLTGLVIRSPISPVCRVGTPCSAPARRLGLVFRRPGATVKTQTDGTGRYRILLPAGTWHVSLGRTGLGTTVEPPTLRVVAGRIRHADLSIDTGIR